MSQTASRYYAIGMAITNVCVAFVLAGMFVVNAIYAYASLLVTLFAPLAATIFALIACMWTVRAFVSEPSVERFSRWHWAAQ